MTARFGTTLRKRWQLFILVFGVLLMAGGVLISSGSGRAQTPPAASPLPSVAIATATVETPRFQALTTPTANAEKPVVEEQKSPPPKPFGPIVAEPVRVFTGDGDCLNVRPSPSKAFATDPRTCVPEGFLLWLYGEAIEAEGETWRWALGEGWVAMRYVKPDPTAKTGFGPMKGVVVTAQDGPNTDVATVTGDGAIRSNGSYDWQPQGLGSSLPGISPSGEWYAYSQQDGYRPVLTVGRVGGGSSTKYVGMHLYSWSPDNKLLVVTNESCPQVCGQWGHGWLDPVEGVVHKLDGLDRNSNAVVWAPDGRSLVAIAEKNGVSRVALDGKVTTIFPKLPDGFEFGTMTISPDDTRLLSVAIFGKVNILDLRTGPVTTVSRAPQIEAVGRCGGASGQLSAWLDERTAIWHESYAKKGGNGITIAPVDGGLRRLIPFFTIQDVKVITPELVSFTTYESEPNGTGFNLTWLLDVKSGEARPVTIGSAAAWIR